jgi:ribosome-binding factor A
VPTTDEAQAETRTAAEIADEAEAARSAATQAALQSAAPHLRAELGRQVRMKYVPELVFRQDPAVEAGERMEQLIRQLHDADGTQP